MPEKVIVKVSSLFESPDNSNLIALSKFVKAMNLLGEVYNESSVFTDDLLPTSTEQFLTEAVEVLNKLEATLTDAVAQ